MILFAANFIVCSLAIRGGFFLQRNMDALCNYALMSLALRWESADLNSRQVTLRMLVEIKDFNELFSLSTSGKQQLTRHERVSECECGDERIASDYRRLSR